MTHEASVASTSVGRQCYAYRTRVTWPQWIGELASGVSQVSHHVITLGALAVLYPRHQVVERLDLLLVAVAAVTRDAHDPLHKQVAFASTVYDLRNLR